MSNVSFSPIGSVDFPFMGSIEGNNHTLSNLKINTGEYLIYGGLIGNAKIENNMTIRNLNFSNYYYCTYQEKESIGSVVKSQVKHTTIRQKVYKKYSPQNVQVNE